MGYREPYSSGQSIKVPVLQKCRCPTRWESLGLPEATSGTGSTCKAGGKCCGQKAEPDTVRRGQGTRAEARRVCSYALACTCSPVSCSPSV